MRTLFAVLGTIAAVGAAGCNPGQGGCVDDEDCSEGFICVVDDAKGERVCADPCAADAKCKDGFACVPIEEAPEGACLAVKDDAKDDGEACGDDRDCKSGACATVDDAEQCAEPCAPGDTCAEGRCTLDGLRYVCTLPLDDKADGEACADSRECTSGTCVVPPGASDAVCASPCASDGDCSDGAACLALEHGAHACVLLTADGGACAVDGECAGGFCIDDLDGASRCASACVDGACAGDLFCIDGVDTSPVCLPPLEQRADGDACASDRYCASRLCRHFLTDTADLGTLCASPCAAAAPQCPDGQVCWDGDDVDVCGPTP